MQAARVAAAVKKELGLPFQCVVGSESRLVVEVDGQIVAEKSEMWGPPDVAAMVEAVRRACSAASRDRAPG